MAGWPAQADYRDALQNADLAFRDPILRACKVERNRMGVPKARSGAFASVYKMVRPNGDAVALKLFNFPSEDRQRRYEAVSQHLASLGGKRPDSLVGFHYSRDGILIGGKSYPFQTMDWVKGESLGEWARKRMVAKDAAAMRAMADLWVKLVMKLQAANIAHGDLQHDNVMIANNLPILVDYDGMWVPALDGADPLEFGKPAYQHPRRGEMKLNRGLDHFSAWIILLGLRASAADPSLYERFVFQVENENLLFSELDLREPKKSKLWPELLKSKDSDVSRWAAEIRAALDAPAERVPPFSMDPFQPLNDLCIADPRDWDAICEEAERLLQNGRKVPPEPSWLIPTVTEARQRVANRDKVRNAFLLGDIRGVAAAYNPSIFDNWANQRGLAKQAAGAQEKVKALDDLKAAVANPGDGVTLVALWAKYGPALANVKEAEAYGKAAEAWQHRVKAAEPFLKVVNNPASTEKNIADAWKAVTAAGVHPTLIPTSLRNRGEQALKRYESLEKLKSLAAQPSEANDRALIANWMSSEKLLEGSPELPALQLRITAAGDRLSAITAIEEALKKVAEGPSGLQVAMQAGVKIPAGYAHRFVSQIELAREQWKHYSALQAALSAKPSLDTAVASAWETLLQTAPTLIATLPLETRNRCEQAVARREGLKKLEHYSKRVLAVDEQDRKLLRVWKEFGESLNGSEEAAKWKDRLDLAQRRHSKAKKLLIAVEHQALGTIRELALDPDLKGYAPVEKKRNRIREMAGVAERIDALRRSVAEMKNGALPEIRIEDFQYLREHQKYLDANNQKALGKLVEISLTRAANLTAGVPPYQLIPGAIPAARVFWEWSGSGLVSRFLLAALPKPVAKPSDAPPESLARCRPEDHLREGGGRLLVLPRFPEVYVCIWAEADLGWGTVHSPPLVIGPIGK